MIDRSILDSLRYFQQNRHIFQTAIEQHRLLNSVSLPRIDTGVLEALDFWSRSSTARLALLAMPNTSEIRDLLHYTQELSALHTQLTSAASVASPHFVPPALLEQTTIEVFSHTRSLEGLFPKRTPEEAEETHAEEEEQKQQIIEQLVEETKSEVEQWLNQLDPPLYTAWQGARQALTSNNPDRARHIMVSLRTLMENLIRRLAPDAEVRAWSTDPQYYQNNGTPTGKGRLFYICRHIHSGDASFAQFLETDVSAITSLWISLNRLHAPKHTLSDVQLRIMVERFEAALLMFIRASEAGEE